MNKENIISKQYRAKNYTEKDQSKQSCQVLALHNGQSRIKRGQSPQSKIHKLNKTESKKNIIGRSIEPKEKHNGVRFPRIAREEPTLPVVNRKKHCKSFKKIYTEPADTDEDLFHIRTLSPKDNMK